MDPRTDAEVIASSLASPAAFGEVFDRHATTLFRYLVRRVGPEDAAYPVPTLRDGKYWPPVGRIDGGYGDRNLVCACPPIEAYDGASYETDPAPA